jgi:23S rRNA (adenine1618-N6)-methyltransferase
VANNPFGDASIDFTDSEAVRTLNRALLMHFYGVAHWDVPATYLCPPIPGRADHLHHLADLLAECNEGVLPKGDAIRVLDIGVGANCVYPILGSREYGWHFLGSEIDTRALAAAQRTVQANQGLPETIELRLQTLRECIFRGVVREGDMFDLSMCNPPFHASLKEACEGTQRKWRNLGKEAKGASLRNFGGQGAELWCPGGESAFVARMIEESATFKAHFFWFSTLVSKASNLPGICHALKQAGALDVRVLEMAQGQKKSRIVAWTFLGERARKAWRRARWTAP